MTEDTEYVRVRLVVSIGFDSATREDEIEIPREQWNDMTEAERDDMLSEAVQELLNEYSESYYEVLED
jgi:hypothetical protein